MTKEELQRQGRNFRRYQIAGVSEEGQCGHCGFPLDVGDFAWEHRRKTGDYPVCSVQCGVRYERRVAEDCKRDGLCPEHGDTMPCMECRFVEQEADQAAREALGSDYYA